MLDESLASGAAVSYERLATIARMTSRQPTRSQRGSQAEAHRRVAERMALAEKALADYLDSTEQVDQARELIAYYERQREHALVGLVEVVGREQASVLAGVDEKQIRAALGGQSRTEDETTPRDSAKAIKGASHDNGVPPLPGPSFSS